MNGWIKLHRKSIESSVFMAGEKVWMVWTYCLMRANHEDSHFPFNGGDVLVKAGSFVTGRKQISLNCKISTQSVRTALEYLKSTNRITIKSNNKFSFISIKNWGDYQQDNQQTNKPLTNQQQTTNKPLTTDKNIKNDKNIVTTNVVTKAQPSLPAIGLEQTIKETYGNKNIDLVLECFYRLKGHKPTDKKPRNVAHNLIQRLQTIMKSLNLEIGDLRTSKWIKLYFQWITEDSDFVDMVQKLETIKLRTVMWEPVITEIVHVGLKRVKKEIPNVQEIIR